MNYSVFVDNIHSMSTEQNNELVDKCVEIAKIFEVNEFKNESETLKYVYSNEKKYSKDMFGKKPLNTFCAYYVLEYEGVKIFNLFAPEDDHFYTYLEGKVIYCETNKKSHDALIKLLMFLLSRYTNGYFSHDGEDLDYFVECLDNYYKDDREKYLNILAKYKDEYNLTKFGLK